MVCQIWTCACNTRKEMPMTTLDFWLANLELRNPVRYRYGGFEHSVLRGLSQPLPFISTEFTSEFIKQVDSCLDLLVALGYRQFNYSNEESLTLSCQTWVTPKQLKRELRSSADAFLGRHLCQTLTKSITYFVNAACAICFFEMLSQRKVSDDLI